MRAGATPGESPPLGAAGAGLGEKAQIKMSPPKTIIKASSISQPQAHGKSEP